MAYLLAIGSAALYGAADFLGDLGSRRAHTIAIVVTSQGAGMMVLLFLLPLLPSASPSAADLFWGGTAGLTGGVGVALLYRALAVGRMAVIAPTTAVCAVTIPVITGVFFGERLAPLTLFGIGLAMVAIALVSRQRTTASGDPASASDGIFPAGIGLALGSGVALGLFFLSLSRTHAEAGMWPLLAARVVSVSLFGAMACVYARPWRMTPAVARIAAAAGVIDMFANALYLAATRYGPLSVVVTLSSLYPASTPSFSRVLSLASVSTRGRRPAWCVRSSPCF